MCNSNAKLQRGLSVLAPAHELSHCDESFPQKEQATVIKGSGQQHYKRQTPPSMKEVKIDMTNQAKQEIFTGDTIPKNLAHCYIIQ